MAAAAAAASACALPWLLTPNSAPSVASIAGGLQPAKLPGCLLVKYVACGRKAPVLISGEISYVASQERKRVSAQSKGHSIKGKQSKQNRQISTKGNCQRGSHTVHKNSELVLQSNLHSCAAPAAGKACPADELRQQLAAEGLLFVQLATHVLANCRSGRRGRAMRLQQWLLY